jgi:ankyrin repeat protein
MIAAMSGNVRFVELLLSKGADVNIATGEMTALAFASDGVPSGCEDLQRKEEKEAWLAWLNATAPGRAQVASMLRNRESKGRAVGITSR